MIEPSAAEIIFSFIPPLALFYVFYCGLAYIFVAKRRQHLLNAMRKPATTEAEMVLLERDLEYTNREVSEKLKKLVIGMGIWLLFLFLI